MRLFDRLSIKSKLIAMLLTVSSCSVLVTAYIGYRSGQSNLTDRVFNQLTSLRTTKSYQIESYFQTLGNHIHTLSEDPTVVSALQDFDGAYRQLETAPVPIEFDRQLAKYYQTEFLPKLAKTKQGVPVLNAYLPSTPAARNLQYHYIAANPNPVGKKHLLDTATDGSPYSNRHARYHPIFRNIIKKFGYYDMFLINPQGTVVYTVYKETDFTTNFTTGAYNESNLARLVASVRRAKQKDFVKLIDFEGYVPSYGAPAAFIAAPVYDRSTFVGVLAVQLPVDEINNVMTGNRNWERDGLGKSGETYLVGRDYLMRSVSRFLVDSPADYFKSLQDIGVDTATINRIRQYNTSILEQKVMTTAATEALANRQGTQIIQDYRNVPVLSSYAPLKIDGLDWAILAEIDLAEAYAPIYAFGNQVAISATLLLLLVTLLAMALANLFVKPIDRLIASARKVEAGDLDTSIALNTHDEFGELAQSFNAMVESLQAQTNLVAQKNFENEQLLLSLFPAAIAKRLKRGEKEIADTVSNVTVLFSDLTGFTKLAGDLTAQELVTILSDLVTSFDDAAERYGIEKIKTIGDSYMAICGLSVPYLDHDKRAVDFALEMMSIVRRFNHERGFELNISVGIHSGDVTAGIIGRHRSIYDVWGNTVNLANALRVACPSGSIFVSAAVYQRLDDLYEFEPAEVPEGNGTAALKVWKFKSIQKNTRSEV
jgi:class 3 adenylate cyclase